MLKRISAIPLAAIVIFSLVLKLALFCYISPWDKQVEKEKIVVSDSWQYETIAENLLKYHTFSSPTDTFNIAHYSDYKLQGYLFLHADSYREPGYPLYLALLYFIFGVKPFIAILLQIILSAISTIFAYKIALLLFNNPAVAKLSALLLALDIHSIFVANELLTDTLLVILFLSAIYFFLKGMKNNKWQSFLWGGVLLGLACLTKPIVLLYPAVLFFIIYVFSGQSRGWRIKMGLLFALVCGGITSIWLVRNHTLYGHWQMTTQGGNDLLFYYSSLTEERITHQNIDSIRVKFQQQADSAGFRNEKDIFRQSDIYKKIAMSYIFNHKLDFLITHFEGGRNMYLSLGNNGIAKTLGWINDADVQRFAVINSRRVLENFKKDKRETALGIIILLVMLIQYGGAVYGILRIYKDKYFMFVFLLLLSIAYFWAVAGVLGSYRYKLPVVPFICIAAGYGYVYLMNKKKDSLKRSEA
jgi:4-amino-4-deoxy-L-arabinose transferase-like glycosyltransferase